MPHGAKSFLAAALAIASGERLVWIARDAEIADRVAEELRAWLGDTSVGRGARAAHSAGLRAHASWCAMRSRPASRRWLPGGRAAPRVLVASVQALFQHTLAPDELPAQPLQLSGRGSAISQERVLRELIDLGYEALPEVAGRGEFARRGGIVDVFPAGQPLPVRIEWFGDEIESLRAFDPANQRGVRPTDAGQPAAGERVPARRDAGTRLHESAGLGKAPRLPPTWPTDLARLEQGQLARRRRGVGRRCWRRRRRSTTSADEIWVVDEPEDVAAAADFLWTQADERRAELEKAGVLPRGWPSAYPGRREWKQTPQRGANARADLGERHRRRAAGRQPVRLARADVAAAGRSATLARRSRAGAAKGDRVVLAS